MNKWIGTGNLVKDPELQQTSSGVSFCNFTLAVNRNYKSDGDTITDFINCVVWRGVAETLCKYAHKGSKLAVQGSIEIKSWEDSNGNKKTATNINVSEIEFLSKSNFNGDNKPSNNNGQSKKKPQLQSFDDDSDIPF